MTHYIYFIEVFGTTGKWYSPRNKHFSQMFQSLRDCQSYAFAYHRNNPKKIVRITSANMSGLVHDESMFKTVVTYGTLSKH